MMIKKPRKKTYQQGKLAELIGCIWLTLKGYRIRHWRYKTPVGEIDIIAQKGQTIIFVEVKRRPSYTAAIESISLWQQHRITQAALWYQAAQKKQWGFSARFDILLVVPWRVHHHMNAWTQFN